MALQVRDKWGIFQAAPPPSATEPATAAGLTGVYPHRCGKDFRLYLPAPFRVLGPTLVLSRQPGGCLRIDSPALLAHFLQIGAERSGDRTNASAFRRYLAGSATFASVDSRGRFVLPTPFRQWVGVQQYIVFVGQEDHVELWALER